MPVQSLTAFIPLKNTQNLPGFQTETKPGRFLFCLCRILDAEEIKLKSESRFQNELLRFKYVLACTFTRIRLRFCLFPLAFFVRLGILAGTDGRERVGLQLIAHKL